MGKQKRSKRAGPGSARNEGRAAKARTRDAGRLVQGRVAKALPRLRQRLPVHEAAGGLGHRLDAPLVLAVILCGPKSISPSSQFAATAAPPFTLQRYQGPILHQRQWLIQMRTGPTTRMIRVVASMQRVSWSRGVGVTDDDTSNQPRLNRM